MEEGRRNDFLDPKKVALNGSVDMLVCDVGRKKAMWRIRTKFMSEDLQG